MCLEPSQVESGWTLYFLLKKEFPCAESEVQTSAWTVFIFPAKKN